MSDLTRLNGGKPFENNALRDIADKMSDDAPTPASTEDA